MKCEKIIQSRRYWGNYQPGRIPHATGRNLGSFAAARQTCRHASSRFARCMIWYVPRCSCSWANDCSMAVVMPSCFAAPGNSWTVHRWTTSHSLGRTATCFSYWYIPHFSPQISGSYEQYRLQRSHSSANPMCWLCPTCLPSMIHSLVYRQFHYLYHAHLNIFVLILSDI